MLPRTPRVESCFQAPRGAVISCSSKRPERRAKGRFITRGPQTSQMRQMPACVCGTRKKGDSWVSRKSGDGKRQPDGPNLGDHHGTLEREIRFRRERRAWFGRGLGEGVSARGLRGISGTVGLVLQRTQQVWGEGGYALGALVQSLPTAPVHPARVTHYQTGRGSMGPSSSFPSALSRLRSGPAPEACFLTLLLPFLLFPSTAPSRGRIYSPDPRSPRYRSKPRLPGHRGCFSELCSSHREEAHALVGCLSRSEVHRAALMKGGPLQAWPEAAVQRWNFLSLSSLRNLSSTSKAFLPKDSVRSTQIIQDNFPYLNSAD